MSLMKHTQPTFLSTPLPNYKSSLHYVPTCRLRVPSFLRRILQRKAPPDRKPVRVTSREEWRHLIHEFEQRANSKRNTQAPPNLPPPYVNPAQFESLPVAETSFMAALTVILWFFGRVMKLDLLLLLWYPLPVMYLAARWGLRSADMATGAAFMLISLFVGPFSGILYLMNIGLLTFSYTRCLWYRAPWQVTLLAGGIAKALGLFIQLKWVSVVIRYDAWAGAAEQVVMLLHGIAALLNNLPGIALVVDLTVKQVQWAILGVVAFHSVYHVFFTIVFIELLILKAKETEEFKRIPKCMPFVNFLYSRTTNLKRW